MTKKICSVEGCERVHVARGYCAKHYDSAKYRGEFAHNLRPKGNRPPCSVDKCDKEYFAKDYCKNHYAKHLKYGDATYAPPEHNKCSCGNGKIANLTMKNGSKGCKNCYHREWYKNAKVTPSAAKRKNGVIGYEGMHYRIRAARGRAIDHICVDCSQSAEQWSLDATADTIVSIKGRRIGSLYSMNVDDYSPRCKSCHIEHDTNVRAGQGYKSYLAS